MTGKVFIASMNMRGVWAPRPTDVMVLNVTSAQPKTNKNRRDFSPMTPVNNGYKGFLNFEAYWQSGKVISGVPHATSIDWWKKIKTAKRRYPGSKHKTVLHSKWDHIDGPLGYVDSRKLVYVPEYYDLISKREMTKHWVAQVKRGIHVAVYDFDGPRENGAPVCMEVTLDLLKQKINDAGHIFGHGYIVAGLILGITPDMYVV